MVEYRTVPEYDVQFDSVCLSFYFPAPRSAVLYKTLDEAHDGAHDEAHELTATEITILLQCQNEPQSTKDLLAALGYNTRTGNFKKSISRLCDVYKFIERTHEKAARSRHQKYTITSRGRAFLKDIHINRE